MIIDNYEKGEGLGEGVNLIQTLKQTKTIKEKKNNHHFLCISIQNKQAHSRPIKFGFQPQLNSR